MRAAIIFLLVLCFVGSAFSVTQTLYTDNTCKTKSSISGFTNPWIGSMNTCSKWMQVNGVMYYSKPTTCSSTSVTYTSCASTDCTGNSCQTFTENVGKCLTTGGFNYILTCDSASTATVALLAVAAAIAFVIL